MSKRINLALVVAVVLLLALSRLVKHPFNFTPVAAMAIFAGCYLRKKWGILLPLLAMLISDYFIGFYDWQVMASVYVSITLSYLIGWFLYKRKKWFTVLGATLISSITFFLLTNFAVWAFFDWYPHTWQGLINNFTLALPFFRNTILGDLVYTGLLFGIFEVVTIFVNKKNGIEERVV